MEYLIPNESNETTISLSSEFFQNNLSLTSGHLASLGEIIDDCNKNGTPPVRVVFLILILVPALPANMLLLWMLLKNRKTLSPSEVLGLNMAVLSVLFCLSLPLDIFISTTVRSGLLLRISHTFDTLSYFGCPLLLTSMCLERYVAVAHPVIFIRLGKWEYRAACCAIIWFLTFIMAVVTFFYTLSDTAMIFSININVLFCVMVACLLGIVWVLRKKCPGDGDQNNSVVKKRALKNVQAVLVPSTITYLPLLGLAPFLTVIQILAKNGTNVLLCNFLELFSVIPSFGVCIGPMFYKARLRQMLCGMEDRSRDTRVTTTDQRN
ncbi:uncharacterized protein Hap1MRO34_008612 [Clarias gariepinus]